MKDTFNRNVEKERGQRENCVPCDITLRNNVRAVRHKNSREIAVNIRQNIPHVHNYKNIKKNYEASVRCNKDRNL